MSLDKDWEPPNTLEDVIQDVQDEMNQAVEPAQITRYCWRIMNRIHRAHLFSWMIRRYQIQLTAAANTQNIPFDVRKMRAIYLLDSSGTRTKKFTQGIDFVIQTRDEVTVPAATTTPTTFEAGTGRVGFKILWDNAASGSDVIVELEYFRWPSRPQEGKDIVDMHPGDIDVLIEGIEAKAYRQVKDYNAATLALREFNQGLQDMVDQDAAYLGGLMSAIPYTIDGRTIDYRESRPNMTGSQTDIFEDA
jgi:hypothetical protein